jgi:hypothetical protein
MNKRIAFTSVFDFKCMKVLHNLVPEPAILGKEREALG